MRVNRLAAAVAVVAALAWPAFASSATEAASDSACSSTPGPRGAYTAGICLKVPTSPAQGDVRISATVTLSTPATLVSYVTFCLDGSASGSPSCIGGGPGYLLRAFKPANHPVDGMDVFSFALPTAHWVDGAHTLLAVAQLADGTQTAAVSAPVSFANGNATQPVNTSAPSFVHPTAPAAGGPLVVAAVGDGAGDDPASAAVARLVAGWSPNLFLYLGDVYDQGAYAEFTNWYDRLFGGLRPITAPVPGNHEYMSSSDPATTSKTEPSGTAYFDYWNNLPNFYGFDAGGWHFIALNANPQMGKEHWQNQLDWLAADETAHASQCTIAFWHEPAFNTGTAGVTPEATRLWSLLAGHVDLVLNAHDHTYQRWTAMDATGRPAGSGTPEIIAGTGGHQPTKIVGGDSRRLAAATSPGALRLRLGRRSATVEFVTSTGTIADSTTVPCRPRTASNVPGSAAGAGGTAGAAGSGPSASGTASNTPASGIPGQRELEVVFVIAIALAAAAYLAAALPFAVPAFVFAGALAAIGAAALRGLAFSPDAGTAVVLAALVAGGPVLARLLPARAAPVVRLSAATIAFAASLAIVVAVARDTAVVATTHVAWLAPAGRALGVSAAGLTLLGAAGVLAAAIASYAGRRGLPIATAVVPTALALVVADALALAAPHALRLPPDIGWPALLLALVPIGWLVTELALLRHRAPRSGSIARYSSPRHSPND